MVEQLNKFPATADQPLPFIGYMPGSAFSNLINKLATDQQHPIHLKTIIETGTAETIKAFVLAGFGLSWLPRMAITEELANGVLTELGSARHQIPFNLELFRCTTNTEPDVMMTWEKLKP